MSHSVIGASSCERFWNCPGSIALSQKAPKPRPSFYAAEGTVAHTIAERYLRAFKPVDMKLLGEVYTEDGFGIEVTTDMLDAVSVYVDTILNLFASRELNPRRLQVEVKFVLPHLDPDARGTGDAGVPQFDRLTVLDYKHGAGNAVEVEENKQTLYYSLGLYYSLKKEDRKYVEDIENIIVQPRCSHADGVVRSVVYPVERLFEFEDGLRQAIKRVRDGDNTLQAGPWCKFCPAKPICHEARDSVARLARVDFANIEAGPPDPKSLSPEMIAALLPHIPRIRDWCETLEKYAFYEADRGVEIPGYMLTNRRSNRKWVNEEAVIDELDLEYGEKIFTKRKLLSPNQLEKLLPKDERGRLRKYWEKPDTGKTLVPVDGKRNKLLPSTVTDFVDLDI